MAIRLSQPDVSEADAHRYATALHASAEQNRFDPLLGVAIIYNESRFRPRAISKNGEDYGLGQIRARYVGACRKDKNPVRRPSARCLDAKEALLEPEENIRRMGELISYHRKVCQRKVKSGHHSRWLASYQGHNHPRENRWCTPGKATWRVLAHRDRLARELERHSASAGATASNTTTASSER